MASVASFGALPLEHLTFGATGGPAAIQRARGLAGCLVRAADLATKTCCVAQELAVRILLDRTEDIAETFAIELPQGWRGDLEEYLLEDLDHGYLYDPSADGFEDDPDFGPGGMAPMGFPDWFTPFPPDEPLPPYLLPDPQHPIKPATTSGTRVFPDGGSEPG